MDNHFTTLYHAIAREPVQSNEFITIASPFPFTLLLDVRTLAHPQLPASRSLWIQSNHINNNASNASSTPPNNSNQGFLFRVALHCLHRPIHVPLAPITPSSNILNTTPTTTAFNSMTSNNPAQSQLPSQINQTSDQPHFVDLHVSQVLDIVRRVLNCALCQGVPNSSLISAMEAKGQLSISSTHPVNSPLSNPFSFINSPPNSPNFNQNQHTSNSMKFPAFVLGTVDYTQFVDANDQLVTKTIRANQCYVLVPAKHGDRQCPACRKLQSYLSQSHVALEISQPSPPHPPLISLQQAITNIEPNLGAYLSAHPHWAEFLDSWKEQVDSYSNSPSATSYTSPERYYASSHALPFSEKMKDLCTLICSQGPTTYQLLQNLGFPLPTMQVVMQWQTERAFALGQDQGQRNHPGRAPPFSWNANTTAFPAASNIGTNGSSMNLDELESSRPPANNINQNERSSTGSMATAVNNHLNHDLGQTMSNLDHQICAFNSAAAGGVSSSR